MTNAKLDPFMVSADVRAFAYSGIVLAWETGRAKINSSTYSEKQLEKEVGLYVLMLRKLADLQSRERQRMPKEEFLVFLASGKGYECLFKRLRDTFAHGHFSAPKHGWIEIRHRFKSSGQKPEQTRIFGKLRISTFKKLVRFLDESGIR